MAHVLADTEIETQRRRRRGGRILDPTDDPTHGQQEFTCFNGHYDTARCLPIVATVTFKARIGGGDGAQHLAHSSPQPAGLKAGHGCGAAGPGPRALEAP